MKTPLLSEKFKFFSQLHSSDYAVIALVLFGAGYFGNKAISSLSDDLRHNTIERGALSDFICPSIEFED